MTGMANKNGTAMRARIGSVVMVAAMSAVMAGCSSGLPKLPKVADLNPFAKKKEPLKGKRIPVMQVRQTVPGELAAADQPIVVPPANLNEDWAQPGGPTTNAPGHLSLGADLKQAWTADGGTGSTSAGRVTASPIVYAGRAYTLDSRGTVSSFALASGARSWHISLKPEAESVSSGVFSLGSITDGDSAAGGYGGGIAAADGKIFGATGYGSVAALDAATGKKIWEKRLNAPVRAAPTVANGRIFVVTIDGRAYCLSALDGVELWVVRGLPQQASLVTSVSPAVSGDTVVIPYPSGDVVALNVNDGTSKWSESLASSRGTSRIASLSDAARPAIADGVVYAVGHAGRLIATQVASGERLWSLKIPGTQTPSVVGQSVYVVDTSGQLLAISRTNGQIQWTAKLPGNIRTWSGPVLAGGLLWLASSKGHLVGADPTTGKVIKQKVLSDPIYIAPIVAQNRMLVFTDNAKLVSLN